MCVCVCMCVCVYIHIYYKYFESSKKLILPVPGFPEHCSLGFKKSTFFCNSNYTGNPELASECIYTSQANLGIISMRCFYICHKRLKGLLYYCAVITNLCSLGISQKFATTCKCCPSKPCAGKTFRILLIKMWIFYHNSISIFC